MNRFLWSWRDSFPSRKLETTSQENKRIAELKRLHQFIQNKAHNLAQQLAQGIVDPGVGSKCAQFIPGMASDKDTDRLKNDAFYSMPMHCNYPCRCRWRVAFFVAFLFGGWIEIVLRSVFFKVWSYLTFPGEICQKTVTIILRNKIVQTAFLPELPIHHVQRPRLHVLTPLEDDALYAVFQGPTLNSQPGGHPDIRSYDDGRVQWPACDLNQNVHSAAAAAPPSQTPDDALKNAIPPPLLDCKTTSDSMRNKNCITKKKKKHAEHSPHHHQTAETRLDALRVVVVQRQRSIKLDQPGSLRPRRDLPRPARRPWLISAKVGYSQRSAVTGQRSWTTQNLEARPGATNLMRRTVGQGVTEWWAKLD